MWFSLAFALTPAQLLSDLTPALERAAASEVLRADFEQLATTHGFRVEPGLYADFVKVVVAFEATREGGWIGNRWAVTNQQPDATQIFSQYQRGQPATAECDELSALFSWTARQLGVKDTGLFWPTWNHTVSVWWFEQGGRTVRIVVPTSQVFLDERQTLGTTAFDPWTQKRIYPYEAKDFRGELPDVFVAGLREGARCALHEGLVANQTRRNAAAGPLRCPGVSSPHAP